MDGLIDGCVHSDKERDRGREEKSLEGEVNLYLSCINF